MEKSTLVEKDLDIIWHPYTQMKTAGAPIPIVRGEEAYLYDENGNRYIDAVSSWWVNIHGHAHPYIAKRVSEQLYTLEHVIFAGFTHPSAVILAEMLLNILPKNQKKIFYSDNGSTAVEVALKMCLQFWSNQGIARTKIVAFENAYHGDTFGAMSVSGRSAFTNAFQDLLFEVEFIPLPTESNIEGLEKHIRESKDEIAAFIFEPLVQGSAGMIMYEAPLLDRLVAVCLENKVLTIADEVMTGFGRTGKLFATDYLTNKADIMCFSKGLTGGTMALGVTTATSDIFDAFLSDDKLKTLFHGHSFTANPIACSASIASMELLLEEKTSLNISRIVASHEGFKERISGHKRLKSVRQTGTIIALEWDTSGNTSYFSNLRDTLYNYFLEQGIILRPLGNIIYILPPYCISDEVLQYIYSKIEEALDIF